MDLSRRKETPIGRIAHIPIAPGLPGSKTLCTPDLGTPDTWRMLLNTDARHEHPQICLPTAELGFAVP